MDSVDDYFSAVEAEFNNYTSAVEVEFNNYTSAVKAEFNIEMPTSDPIKDFEDECMKSFTIPFVDDNDYHIDNDFVIMDDVCPQNKHPLPFCKCIWLFIWWCISVKLV